MTDTTLGLRFTADQRELQQAADKGTEAVRKIGDEAKRSNDQAARAAQQYTESLKRQADTLGMTRSQTMAYEASQQKLTEAQRQSVTASISAIDAYDRKQAMLGRVQVAAAAAGTALSVVFVAGIKASITAAAEAERSQLRLEAVLKATQYAAGLSGAELEQMASELQDSLGIDDEPIKDAMAVLLTFKEVSRDSYGEAMKVAANLSAVMKTDLSSAVMQLGKALQDPEQGLTALTRSGISFSGAQKTMIKDMVETGRQSEAITEILRIMKDQGLNGVREMMNTGLPGAINSANVAWGEFLESLGKTPAVGGVAESVLRGIAGHLKDIRALSENGGGIDNLLGIFAAYRIPRAAELRAQQKAVQAQDDREQRRGDVGASAVEIADRRKVEQAREQASTYLQQFRSDGEKLEAELDKWRARAKVAKFTAAETEAGEAKIRAALAKKGSADSKEGARLITSLNDQLQNASGEASVFDSVMRKVTDGTHKFTEAEIAAALAIAGEIDERKRARKEVEDSIAAYDRDVAKRKAADAVIAGMNESLSTQAQRLQMEIDLMNVSDAQREKTIALRELDNKFIKETINLKGEELARAYALYKLERERIAGLLDQRGAAQEQKKAQDEAIANQRRFNDELARGLTDSIFRGFEGGKSFARNFWDSMKNMAKTTILQPIVKFLVSPITSAIGGVLGGVGVPGMANASGGGVMSGLMSGGGGLSNMMGWVTNSGGGGGIAGMAGMLTGGFDSIFQSAGVGMGSQFIADIGNYGLGMPIAGGLLQMAMGNVKGGALSMAGGAIGSMFGPVGTVVGSAIGSMLGGGSKKKPASFTGMDMTGTITRQGLLGGQFYGNDANQGYRWSTTDHWATDPFNAHVKTMFDELEKVGKALGLDTSVLNSASVGFSASGLSNLNSQQIADEMAAQLGTVSDQLAEQLMPNLKAFAQANETLTQTLMRLGEAQRQANLGQIFNSMQGALKLADETRGLWLSDLSPLTAQQRLAEASGRYNETLAAAQAGDLGAMNELSGMARGYLGEARGFYASSGSYTDIFNQVQGQIGGLVENTLVEQSIAFSEMGIPLEQISNNTKDLDKRIAAALSAALAARSEADAAAMHAQTEALVRSSQDLASTLKSFIDARVLS